MPVPTNRVTHRDAINCQSDAYIKGALGVVGDVRAARVIKASGAFTEIATAGAATITIAQLLTGTIIRDCAGAGRTDTLPTAALLVAGIDNCEVGDTISCYYVNASDAAETITLAAGTGGALTSTQTAGSFVIPQNTSKIVKIRVTNVGSGTEAYVVAA